MCLMSAPPHRWCVVFCFQLAVTALDLLGVDYTKLQGAAAEGTKPLPGLSGARPFY